MGRKVIKCKPKCENHSFSLKPLNYSAYLSKDVTAEFCPNNKQKISPYPIFNNDEKHYTPSFILELDRAQINENQVIYKTQHDKKVLVNANSASQIMIAKPRSKNSYCAVCKQFFYDYLIHIKSNKHRSQIRSNKYQFFIKQLCDYKLNKLESRSTSFESTCLQSSPTISDKIISAMTSFEERQSLSSNPSIIENLKVEESKKTIKFRVPIIINSNLL